MSSKNNLVVKPLHLKILPTTSKFFKYFILYIYFYLILLDYFL